MKTKPTRVFLFDQGLTRTTIDQLPPETQAMLAELKPEPMRAGLATLAPQSNRHTLHVSERGKYQQSGGERW